MLICLSCFALSRPWPITTLLALLLGLGAFAVQRGLRRPAQIGPAKIGQHLLKLVKIGNDWDTLPYLLKLAQIMTNGQLGPNGAKTTSKPAAPLPHFSSKS